MEPPGYKATTFAANVNILSGYMKLSPSLFELGLNVWTVQLRRDRSENKLSNFSCFENLDVT